MSKSSENTQVVTQQTARILRGCRKILGLTQKNVALRLGVNSRALSRIEKGTQLLTAPQWFEFCEMVGISPNSLTTGYVEVSETKRKAAGQSSGIKLPRRYAHHANSRIRITLPFLSYCKKVWGEEKLNQYLEFRKVDPDLFVDLSGNINIGFGIDLVRELIQKSNLTKKNISDISLSVTTSGMHGSLHKCYNEAPANGSALIYSLINNIAQYETNFQYRVEDWNSRYMDISVTPNEHMEAFNYRNDTILGDFFCHYKRGFLVNFSTYQHQRAENVIIKENHYKGAPRCLYRVQTVD